MVHQLASEFVASKDERYVASVIYEGNVSSDLWRDKMVCPIKRTSMGAHRLQGVAAKDGSTSHPRKPWGMRMFNLEYQEPYEYS